MQCTTLTISWCFVSFSGTLAFKRPVAIFLLSSFLVVKATTRAVSSITFRGPMDWSRLTVNLLSIRFRCPSSDNGIKLWKYLLTFMYALYSCASSRAFVAEDILEIGNVEFLERWSRHTPLLSICEPPSTYQNDRENPFSVLFCSVH